MNSIESLFAAILIAALPGLSFAANEHADHAHEKKAATTEAHVDDAKPEHGGVTTVVKDKTLELVLKADRVELHIHDHGKPVSLTKASANVSLQSPSGIRDVALKPAGEKLEATGTFKIEPGMKAVANVALNGDVFLARFELP